VSANYRRACALAVVVVVKAHHTARVDEMVVPEAHDEEHVDASCRGMPFSSGVRVCDVNADHMALTHLVDLLGLQFAASSRSVPVGQQHHGHTDARLLMTTQEAPSSSMNEKAS